MVIDVALFVLVGHLGAALLIAATTFAGWWLLSDYYMAREFPWWTETMDLFAFIAVPAVVILLMIAFFYWKISRGLASSVTVPWLISTEISLDVPSWQLMFTRLGARTRLSQTADFLQWLSNRLTVVSPTTKVMPAHVMRCWWGHKRALVRVWALLAWWPVLCVTLMGLPRYTNVMESMATIVMGYPPQIFDVIVHGALPGPPTEMSIPRNVTESIYSPQRGKLQRKRTALVSNGFIIVRVSAFPRVYLRIKALCLGTCPDRALAADAETELSLAVDVPLRAGVARLHFLQFNPEPRLGLHLWLMRSNGAVIDEVAIEP